MKLYYSSGACSLSPHILLNELGLKYSLIKVNLRDKTTESGQDFYAINPKGQVPTLALKDGKIITEGVAIAQYLADTTADNKLLAPLGQLERYQSIGWYNFIATELHKNYAPLFHDASAEEKTNASNLLIAKYAYVNKHLTGRNYLVGDHFTIADAYLYVVLRWRKMIVDFPEYPALEAFIKRIQARPAVQKALTEEGIS